MKFRKDSLSNFFKKLNSYFSTVKICLFDVNFRRKYTSKSISTDFFNFSELLLLP